MPTYKDIEPSIWGATTHIAGVANLVWGTNVWGGSILTYTSGVASVSPSYTSSTVGISPTYTSAGVGH